PPTADLLAMLCDGVPADAVLGADFAVAYEVSGPQDGGVRTVVRARPDGRLGVDPDTTSKPDSTISVDGPTLLALLDGSSAATVEGDQHAAETLHRWLRGVQGL
nr:hypothetical protein [Solirubrobacterales bacterium]